MIYVTYISIATIGLNGAHLHMLTSGVNALFMIYLLIIYLSIFSVWWYACQIITLLLGYLASAPGAQGVGLTREKKRAPGIYCMRMREYTVLFTV